MATKTTSDPGTAVLQFRAEPELMRQIKETAAKHRVSANRYLVEAVKEKLALEKEQEWREGFEAMGRDPDSNVEYMLPAAREVILDT